MKMTMSGAEPHSRVNENAFFLPYIFLQSDWLVQVSHEI